jgi:hypothetical protein
MLLWRCCHGYEKQTSGKPPHQPLSKKMDPDLGCVLVCFNNLVYFILNKPGMRLGLLLCHYRNVIGQIF